MRRAQCCSTRRRSIRPGELRTPCSGCARCSAQQRIPNVTIEQGFPFAPIDKLKRRTTESRTLSGFGRVIQVDVEEEV